MPWGLAAEERVTALDARVEALTGRTDDLLSRLDRLAAELERLSSALDHVRHRADAEGVDHRRHADQLATARNGIVELQGHRKAAAEGIAALQTESGATREALADLRERGRAAAEAMDAQSARLDALDGRGGDQGRTLDQVRADVTRMERQSAADLAELRATDTALARAVLRANAEPGVAAPRGPAGPDLAGRAHEAADELAAPGAAPLGIVEEEPAERQAAD